eukprot:6286140-Amphidinium_carterae.1
MLYRPASRSQRRSANRAPSYREDGSACCCCPKLKSMNGCHSNMQRRTVRQGHSYAAGCPA